MAKSDRPIIAPIGGSVRFINEFTDKGGHGIEITGKGDYLGYSVKIGYIHLGYDRDSIEALVDNLITNIDAITMINTMDRTRKIPPNMFKETVKAGELVCYANDMVNGSLKTTSDGVVIIDKNNNPGFFPGYKGKMTNHIHLEIRYNGALINPVKAPYQTKSIV